LREKSTQRTATRRLQIEFRSLIFVGYHPDTRHRIPDTSSNSQHYRILCASVDDDDGGNERARIKNKKKKTKTKKNLAAFRIRISRLAFTFFNVFFLFNMFRFARTTSTMSDVVDEAVLDSQDSVALIADAMEIVLRCGALYGNRPAAASSTMPKVSLLLPRFADLWRGGTAKTAFEFIDGEMNLVEFVLFCLVCAVGRPTGGFTSVDDASQQQHSGDAVYDAFRCSRDVRRTCDMVSRKPLPPVRFNVVASGDRHSTYPHVHTIFSARGIGSNSNISISSSISISNNSATSLASARSDDGNTEIATATVRSDDDNKYEIADVRAIAAAVFRAAKALLTTVERGGNRARGGGAEFYEACFHKYLRAYGRDLRLIDSSDDEAARAPSRAFFLLCHTGIAKPSCCVYVFSFFLSFF
jgi:hypothetical protein